MSQKTSEYKVLKCDAFSPKLNLKHIFKKLSSRLANRDYSHLT